MIVSLSHASPAALGDLDRLDRLHATCDGSPGDMHYTEWCVLDDDAEHVWLDIAACRTLGREAAGAEWVERYDGMIAYAVSKGWTDPAGTRVRAHIERTDTATADAG